MDEKTIPPAAPRPIQSWFPAAQLPDHPVEVVEFPQVCVVHPGNTAVAATVTAVGDGGAIYGHGLCESCAACQDGCGGRQVRLWVSPDSRGYCQEAVDGLRLAEVELDGHPVVTYAEQYPAEVHDLLSHLVDVAAPHEGNAVASTRTHDARLVDLLATVGSRAEAEELAAALRSPETFGVPPVPDGVLSVAYQVLKAGCARGYDLSQISAQVVQGVAGPLWMAWTAGRVLVTPPVADASREIWASWGGDSDGQLVVWSRDPEQSWVDTPTERYTVDEARLLRDRLTAAIARAEQATGLGGGV